LVSLSGTNGLKKMKTNATVNGVVNGVPTGDEGRMVERKLNLAVPKSVIEEGVRVTRDCLELVCEIDE
jgi:hypothetical protein